MSLSRKERDQLAEVIQRENEMVLKVGRMVRNAFILTLALVLLHIGMVRNDRSNVS